MTTMRFMSTLPGRPSKVIDFDSSPGRAIGQLLDAGCWDEMSYTPVLKEDNGDEKTFEVSMRLLATETSPGPHPLRKVGVLHWRAPENS